FGDGQAIYIGAVGDGPLYEILSSWLLGMTGIKPRFAVSEGIEVAERWRDDQRLLFLLNHSNSPQKLVLDGRYRSLLDDSILDGSISLAPHDVLILRDCVESHP
ncbi:MAG TPA: Beta-galactosidase C-terminal domain, partial [Anaerolineales bacterium]|nr:Beta-galactosidase C-terminal domain [Anaerolineales bacterium]